MKTTILLTALCLVSCGSTQHLDNESGGLTPLVDMIVSRHDSYTADPRHRAESAALLQLFQLESVPIDAALTAFQPVAQRHDDFVRNDDSITDLERRLALFSTENIRRTLTVSAPPE